MRSRLPRWCPSANSFLVVAVVLDAALTGVTRLDVQHGLYEKYPAIEDVFGRGPFMALSEERYESVRDNYCAGVCSYSDFIAEQKRDEVARVQPEGESTTQLVQLMLMYTILGVMPARHAVLVGVLAPTSYLIVVVLANESYYGQIHIPARDLMVFGIIGIVVITKHFMERSKFQLFKMYEGNKQEVVCQKVLRCQAEFALDTIQMGAPVCATLQDVASTHASAHSTAAQTAPPILTPFRSCTNDCDQLLGSTIGQGQGDCLPADGVAWVENCTIPQTLSSLQPGARIMCYDNLAKSVKYATVVTLRESHNKDWVKVVLADGSTLKMTSDHPVAVQGLQSAGHGTLHGKQKCVSAGDLKPGEDCLMVLKMVWTQISSVEPSSAEPADTETDFEAMNNPGATVLSDSKPMEWMTITVEQPERHEIFVSTEDKSGMPGVPIAVGSSDRTVGPSKFWSYKNTFIHVEADDEPVLRRSNSDPILHTKFTDITTNPKQSLKQQRPRSDSGSGSTPFKETLTSSGSIRSSSISKGSEDGPACVKLGESSNQEEVNNKACVSDVLRVHQDGLPSIGSNHPPGACSNPCTFQFSFLHIPGKAPCKCGALCEFCHDGSHHPRWRSYLRKGKLKSKKQQIVSLGD